MFESSERVHLMKLVRRRASGKLRFLCEKVQRNGGFGKKLSILGLFTGIPMFEVRSKFDHSKFGSFVGSIKVGSVCSKFGKDEVQTALLCLLFLDN